MEWLSPADQSMTLLLESTFPVNMGNIFVLFWQYLFPDANSTEDAEKESGEDEKMESKNDDATETKEEKMPSFSSESQVRSLLVM